MDQRGAQLAPLVEIEDLRSLVARPGDFLTVTLPLRPANEELAGEVRLEWRALRAEAERSGAPPERLEAVDRAVEGAHRRSAGLHVVVPGEGAAHVEALESPPPRGRVTWGPVPALVPLLADRQRRQPHVVVLVDRQGADIVTSTGGLATPPDAPGAPAGDRGETTTVEGESFPLRKVAAGGWLQRRFQQHAEETWRHNMGEVAHEVTAQVERVDARFVGVGGDERAVGLLLDHLPARVRELVRPLPGITRAADGSAARLADEVGRLLGGWLDAEVQRTLETYREELGQRDRAVAGPADTLAALRSARVAQLLVDGTLTDGAQVVADVAGANEATGGVAGLPPTASVGAGDEASSAWIGAGPEEVSSSREDLLDPGRARPAAAVDAAVAAALATGADVRVLPAKPDEPEPNRPGRPDQLLPDGLGALLRW